MGQPVSILCLGDSITFGGSRSDYARELPLCIERGIEVTKEGYPGFGAKDLKRKLEESLDRKAQHLVCFMAGTNDLLMNPAAEIIVTIRAAWKVALARGIRVVALTTPEGRLNTDFYLNGQELNRLIKAAVIEEQCELLTYYDVCGALPTQESRPDMWEDQVHPNAAGYYLLGTGLGKYLNRLLISLDPLPRSKKTLFRPCIDLHSGVVKQIVGGTLSDDQADAAMLKTNYVSEKPASFYAELYRKNDLFGGHVIMLGPNCTEAAKSALSAWPNHLQIGGGINDSNAGQWLEAGAQKVILTSWLFPDGNFSMNRLKIISDLVGRERLVIDLSCRLNKGRSGWTVAMNKWQTLTNLEINNETLDLLRDYCSEFLIHAADVEGLQDGVDEHLVEYLGLWAQSCKFPFNITYAGGARSVKDLENVNRLSQGYVDLTIGSALDIFGGKGATLEECIEWNKRI